MLLTDAQAVTDGSHMEWLNRPPRWLAATYVMIRWVEACRAILLARVASEDMVADIVTIAIVGAAVYALRAPERVRVVLPPMGFDSTAAAELHATTMAFKHTVPIRTLQSELELGVVPTVLLMDTQAVTDGSHMERLTGKTRWLAAKYAMNRWGVACRAIMLERVATIDMVADIVTKSIVGAAFYALRARVLGLLPGPGPI
jgi:hypothetical protein